MPASIRLRRQARLVGNSLSVGLQDLTPNALWQIFLTDPDGARVELSITPRPAAVRV
jgi:hypothetical protein